MFGRSTDYCEGAWLKAPETGERWVTLPGNQVYHDAATGIWYCYAQGMWHYSIDTCQTWVDVPMLDIRIVEGAGIIDWFDGKQWTHLDPLLEFFDSRYAQSGWHNMSEFKLDLYDGAGYEGEPLKIVYAAITEEQSRDTVWLNNLVPTGLNPEPPAPDAGIKEWVMYVYGQWTTSLKATWAIPNPSQDYVPWTSTEPLTVVVQSHDFWEEYGKSAQGVLAANFIPLTLKENVIWASYKGGDYSLERLVDDLEIVQYCYSKNSPGSNLLIKNLVIMQHADVGDFKVGSNTIGSYKLLRTWPVNWLPSFGLDEDFARLNKIMVDGGQIQHWGCHIAGYVDPFGSIPPEWLDDPSIGDAMNARRLLSTIANLTNTYVFVSTDENVISLQYSEQHKSYFVVEGECCLEFGVGPNGYSVNYESCSMDAWNVSLWVPEGGAPEGVDPSSLQTLWDSPGNRTLPTFGETNVNYYPFLKRWLFLRGD